MVIQPSTTKTKKNKSSVVNMNIDLRTLTILCRYSLSGSQYFRVANVTNLKKFVAGLNIELYENDREKIKRIEFLQKVVEARTIYGLIDTDMIISHIENTIGYKIDFLDLNNLQMDKNELKWCNEMVAEALKYSFVYDYMDGILDICTRIKSSDYSTRGALISQFEGMIDALKNSFRTCKVADNLTEMTFSLRNQEFVNAVTETYKLITNPSRKLTTGMIALNEMIDGGFESGRVYCLCGITGVGKSVTLLNIVYQLKKYNTHYKPKDPTKTPCIVLLTMENTVVETITRLFDLSIPMSEGMENYTLPDVLKKLREEGGLVLNDSSPIDIVIKYRPNMSEDTSYLYTMCDDLEDDGYEVICVVQDHVKRIRSIYPTPDNRIELGNVVNEMKVFAAAKDIPVITNTHLNRDASKVVEDSNNKHSPVDVTMKLGKSNIGESMLLLDNLDFACIINIDFDDENNKYMAFNVTKIRVKNTRTYFAQPFAYGSSIKLLEDVGQVPMFKDSIHANRGIMHNQSSIKTSASSIMTNIAQIDDNTMHETFAPRNNYLMMPDDSEPITPSEFDQPLKTLKVVKPIIFNPYISQQPNEFDSNALSAIKNRFMPKENNIIIPFTFEDAI